MITELHITETNITFSGIILTDNIPNAACRILIRAIPEKIEIGRTITNKDGMFSITFEKDILRAGLYRVEFYGTGIGLNKDGTSEDYEIVETLSSDLFGDLAYYNLVQQAMTDEALIIGGFIAASLINANDIFAQNITASGTISVGTTLLLDASSVGKLTLGPSASSITETSDTGIYLDGNGEFNFSINSTNYLRKNGSSLEIKSTQFSLIAGSTIIFNTSKLALGISADDIDLSTGIGFYTDISGNFKVGSTTQYIKFDGTNISWKGTNSELTSAGAFTATNATITGNVTITGGSTLSLINSKLSVVGISDLDSTIITGGLIKASVLNVIDVFSQNITATGTITGVKIRTDSGSNRIEMDNSSNSINFYSGGLLTCTLSSGGNLLFDSGTSFNYNGIVISHPSLGAGFSVAYGLLTQVNYISASGHSGYVLASDGTSFTPTSGYATQTYVGDSITSALSGYVTTSALSSALLDKLDKSIYDSDNSIGSLASTTLYVAATSGGPTTRQLYVVNVKVHGTTRTLISSQVT